MLRVILFMIIWKKVLNLNISYSSKSITFEPFDEQAYQLFGDVSVAYSATVRSIVYLEKYNAVSI